MSPSFSRPYRDENLSLDPTTQTIAICRKPMILTRKEFELLQALTAHAGQVLRRDSLLMSIWGYRPEIRTRTLDVHIRRLRRKLRSYSPDCIETIFGVGYRFQPAPGKASTAAYPAGIWAASA